MSTPVTVWSEAPSVIRLRLFETVPGQVTVKIVGPSGDPLERGSLVTISSEGYRLAEGVNPEAGMALDTGGKMRCGFA